MKKQKKKSLQIVKRIVTLFLILAITSTQIEPSVFAASSDGQWASESLKEDAVTEIKSADATADSTETTNTDESHTDESETAKKPETTDGTAQDPGNAGTTDGSTQDPGNTGTADKTEQNPDNTDNTDKTEQDPDNTDNTDKTEQDPDNTDNTDKTAQDPETVVTEEQPTEEPDENLSAADAVLPVEISYYLPKFQELKIEAPEEYTDTEQQEEARAAVTDQAMADETTQKLLEQADKDAESADADESAVDTQALTESAVSEEEYVSYTQMAVTGDTLAAPAVSLPDDVQLDPEADPEDTDPLIGWQVAKLAGIVLSYADGTKINEGDVIPADQINEVSAAAADDGIALMSIDASALAELIALTQDMSVVQRVGDAGTNGKWSILVQGGTNQTDTAGTVRHAYGTIANALKAINADTGSNSFKITLLDNYVADSTDIDALGKKYIGTTQVVSRTDKPTIVFTGAVNYAISTSYQSWNTLTFPNSSSVYFSGYDPYFTRINIDGSGLSIYGNQNNTSFVDMKFVSGVEYLYGGRYDQNASTVNYTLTLDQITTTADAPIKKLYAGSFDNETGNVTLKITNSEIYGNVYASGRTSNYTQTGNVTANLKNVSIYRYQTIQSGSVDRVIAAKDMLFSIDSTGGAFWGADGKVSGNVSVTFEGDYYAQYGTWFGTSGSAVNGTASFDFDITNEELKYVGNYKTKVGKYNYIYVDNTNLANVFGWDKLYLSGCNVAPEQHFGHMQYSSSFYGYWSKIKDYDSTSFVSSSYSPDLTTCSGDTYLQNTTKLNSTGQGYDNSWSRQCYNHIHLRDNTTQIYAGGQATTNSNTMRVDGYFYGDSYKVRLMCSQTTATTEAAANIFLLFQSNWKVTNAMKYMNAYSVSGVPYKMVASDKYLKVYSSSATQYKVTLTNSVGTVIKTGDDIATVLKALANTSYSSGKYTVNLSGPYTLTDGDVTALNTTGTNIQNKDIVIQGTGTFVAGGNAKREGTSSYRFARVYPNFRSLTWKNIIFRQDFLDNSNSWYINANGHSMTFEDCTFTGPVIIDAGGNSTAGTSGSTLTVKNCINVNRICANRTSGSNTLGYTTITVESCGGYGTAGVTIDPAGSGSVQNLTVNVTDTKATVDPTYKGNVSKINRNYMLNVTDSNIVFTNPVVSSSYTATTNLQGNVVLTGTCTGRTNSSTLSGEAILNVYDTVKTQENVTAYLADFDTINISGELRLGNYANSKDSGFYYTYVRPDVTLFTSGKLILERLASGTYYRTINSLKSNGTNTEISFPYIYDGTSSSLAGRPLIVQNTMSLTNSSEKLRVSTSLIPTHTGTTEYPLIQFNSSSNAKLEQYTWIADQRYYLAKGSNTSLIVLRADTYPPLIYQTSTTNVTWNTGSQNRTILLYIRDYGRDAIDKTGESIVGASGDKYPSGVQVYLSTQNVPKKDGTFGYVYDASEGDVQLNGGTVSTNTWYGTSGTSALSGVTDVNGAAIQSTTESPVLKIEIKSRKYETDKRYFIYVRDVAGNWSKFLLDTQGPTMDYDNVTSTWNNDGTFSYSFSNLNFTDAEQSAETSDISDRSYVANASKYMKTNKKIASVRYNFTGKDPWDNAGYDVAFNTSTGVCTLNNVKFSSANASLYIFAKDGYGNKSKYEFVPVTFDTQSNGATKDGKFSNGDRYLSTLCWQGNYLKQEPTTPLLKNLSFQYWYESTDSNKSEVSLSRTPITKAKVYYPLWKYPTLTISNQVAGKAANKNKAFTYTVIPFKQAGGYYANTQFSYKGGTVAGISGVTAPGSGTKTSSSTGALTFTLTHGQSVTISMPGYYDYVQVKQTEISPYWTTYTNEANEKYKGVDTGQISMGAMNRTFAFVNNNDKSQPVVYQSQMSNGVWTAGTADGYGRKLTIYIRDLYGDGIDKTGTSYATGEKYKPSTFAQVYLSTHDASQGSNGFNYQYDSTQDKLLEDISTCYSKTQEIYRDINGNTIPIFADKPVMFFQLKNNYKFEAGTRYFIYVRDLTGKWSKFLLDTDGPQVADEGTVSVTKSGDNYTCTINSMKFEDEVVSNVSTSALNGVEGFTYSANATKESKTKIREVRYNTTGVDPFADGNSASYSTATKNGNGTYNIPNVTLTSSKTLYIFAQDAYNNVTAVQYVPVTFDATAGGRYKKTVIKDNIKEINMLAVKGEVLKVEQIPSDLKFNVSTTQKFIKWYKSTDITNKAKVDLTTYKVNTGTIFYAEFDVPGITITQSVSGDASNKNQKFEYTVQLLDENGDKLSDGTSIPYEPYVIDGSGAEAPNVGTLTVTGKYGEISFSLKHGQAIKLLPGALKYKVNRIQQDSAGYACTYKVDGQENEGTEAYDIIIDEIEGQVDFVNTKDIVVTGISDGLNSKTLPIVGLAAAVVMLGASALMLKRRRRS